MFTHWLLTVFSPYFSLLVNLAGAQVLLAKLLLKVLPAPKAPGIYQSFIQILEHYSTMLGRLVSQI